MEEEYRNQDTSAASSDEKQQQDKAGHWLTFTDKRLCERWLDNLFMVLYEDLRIYTIWRAELAHYESQSIAYESSATD